MLCTGHTGYMQFVPPQLSLGWLQGGKSSAGGEPNRKCLFTAWGEGNGFQNGLRWKNVLSLLTEFPTTRKKKSHLHANLLSVLRLWESDWCLLAPLLYNNKTTSYLFMSSFTSILNKLHSLCIMFFRCILQEFVASTIKILRQIFPTIYFVVLTNV